MLLWLLLEMAAESGGARCEVRALAESRLLMHYLLNLFIASVSRQEILGNRVLKVVNHFRPSAPNLKSNSGDHKTSLNMK